LNLSGSRLPGNREINKVQRHYQRVVEPEL